MEVNKQSIKMELDTGALVSNLEPATTETSAGTCLFVLKRYPKN